MERIKYERRKEERREGREVSREASRRKAISHTKNISHYTGSTLAHRGVRSGSGGLQQQYNYIHILKSIQTDKTVRQTHTDRWKDR